MTEGGKPLCDAPYRRAQNKKSPGPWLDDQLRSRAEIASAFFSRSTDGPALSSYHHWGPSRTLVIIKLTDLSTLKMYPATRAANPSSYRHSLSIYLNLYITRMCARARAHVLISHDRMVPPTNHTGTMQQNLIYHSRLTQLVYPLLHTVTQ